VVGGRQRGLDGELRGGAHGIWVARRDARMDGEHHFAWKEGVLLACISVSVASPPGPLATRAPLRMRRPVPLSVMGTMGAPSLAATEKAPFLNSAIFPDAERVPCMRD